MKKSVFVILSAFLLLAGYGGYKFWNYYQETYVGEDYYAIVKTPLPSETIIKDASGNPLGPGYNYQLQAVNLAGEERKLDYEIITSGEYKNSDPLSVGTLFKVKASKRRIIQESIITEQEIPASIKDRLLKNKEGN